MRLSSFGAALALALALPAAGLAAAPLPPETYAKGADSVTITLYGHASLAIAYRGLVVYVDPLARYIPADQPKADYIFITHEHGDHLDPAAVKRLSKPGTVLVANQDYPETGLKARVLANGQGAAFAAFSVLAVPAYNTTPGREAYHPKGRDDGYVFSLGSIRLYVAGDTENIPELAELRDIDIAFLPANQPYTMTIDQIVAAANALKPKILYPYHLGDTDLAALEQALKQKTAAEIRLRPLR